MPNIAIPQETLDRILRQQTAVLVYREIRAFLAYYKCVQETGGDWDNPDCLARIEPPSPGEELPLLEELLAHMPEDEQLQVATSILEAQARLMEQYIPEVEELISTL